MTVLSEALPVDKLGFGIYYGPKMLSAKYAEGKWGPLELKNTGEISIHPGAKTLHYAQEIFEGLKAYLQKDGSLAMFRPEANIARMTRSAEMLSMPPFPEAKFLEGLKSIIEASKDFATEAPGALYLRPTMICTTPSLGVAPGTEYLFYILLCPVGGYFGSAHVEKPVEVSVLATDEYVRAVRGGIGSAKTGGNYAASLRAIQHAKKHGFNNVLFLDAINQKSLEELGGMNLFIVQNGELQTPTLTDSILAGVTRDSILKLANSMGIKAVERTITIDELLEGIENSKVEEVFACGTAAVVSAITELGWKEKRFKVGNGESGPITQTLFQELTNIHYGKKKAPFPEWMLKV
ncbi:branched-chain amino acid aminotransferase [bacterium]|nr:branched-chain amino acid aminotransferase [bacterium]